MHSNKMVIINSSNLWIIWTATNNKWIECNKFNNNKISRIFNSNLIKIGLYSRINRILMEWKKIGKCNNSNNRNFRKCFKPKIKWCH